MAPAQGQDTVEYALLIAASIIAIVLGVFWFGAAIQAWFNHLVRVMTTTSLA
jgi:Flp pilus assembly pilin Flp